MDWQLLVSGLIIGIAVAAPIGPINLMAIRNTIAHGFWAGVFTGTGAVLGDGTFAVFAAFGITAVSSLIIDYASWIQVAGGLILILIGVQIMLSPAAPIGEAPPPHASARRSLRLIATTYVLTITNPATFMGFVAIFGGVGNLVSRPGDYAGATAMVIAVMAGSLAWWLMVSWLTTLLRERVEAGGLRYINWGSGAVIVLFGLAIFVRLLWG